MCCVLGYAGVTGCAGVLWTRCDGVMMCRCMCYVLCVGVCWCNASVSVCWMLVWCCVLNVSVLMWVMLWGWWCNDGVMVFMLCVDVLLMWRCVVLSSYMHQGSHSFSYWTAGLEYRVSQIGVDDVSDDECYCQRCVAYPHTCIGGLIHLAIGPCDLW